MSEPQEQQKIYTATVTDRGLNERRPLNEDSFLAAPDQRIYAVADGVGGAEAGEVASRTAIEVLEEAFRHQTNGADIEDLMELAIQRANASIHQMAREHAKLTNMATTIVALHLDGNVATIGHVGDSRLYCLTPDCRILRETEDHSIVEEEVRAGRMTPEQAANHPSKNVISRALGAEETVEVDLKTIEADPGTVFLLCSDGITRHIPDHELRQVLVAESDLNAACAELKRRCFERGAEDNLTAVIVRLGEPSVEAREAAFGERTLSFDYPQAVAAAPAIAQPTEPVGNFDLTEDALTPASRIAFPARPVAEAAPSPTKPISIPDTRRSGGGGFGKFIARLFVFLLFVAGVGAAFYGGTRYHGPLPFGLRVAEPSPTPTPSPVAEVTFLEFEKARREVDRAPAEWLSGQLPKQLARQNILNPIDSTEPAFLYLYGRALLLSGSNDEAAKAFAQSIARADQAPNAENATIRKEAALALAAIALKSGKEAQRATTHFDELVAKPASPSPR
jgi:serine/threonine protein phosphatase PrpC